MSTGLEDVVGTFRKWLHLPDPTLIHVTLATVAANRLPGDPVWLLNVGPPGSGKTEVIGSLSRLADVHPTSTLTEPALLSGVPKKEHTNGAKGGLLRQVGDFGILTVKDFTSILAMNRDSRSAVLAALREIYDGSWTRHVGTSGGITLTWEGKLGMIGGCTPTIDSHHAVVGAMGERMVLYRLPRTDGEEQGGRALDHLGHEQTMREQLATAVASLFDSIDGWHLPARTLSDPERERLVSLAHLGVRCRSAVERDNHTREIELVPEAEAPGRLVLVLAQLLAGLELIGVGPADVWRTLVEITLGCMPALRRAALDTLVDLDRAATTTELATALGYPTSSVRRSLEDLACHGVVLRKQGGEGKADWFELADWTKKRWPDPTTVPESPSNQSLSYLSLLVEGGISGKVAGQ